MSAKKSKGKACPKAPAAPKPRRMIIVKVTNRVNCLVQQDYGNLLRAVEAILKVAAKRHTLLPIYETRMRELYAVRNPDLGVSNWDGFIPLRIKLTPEQFAILKPLAAELGLSPTQGMALALNWDAQFSPPDDNAGEEWKRDQPVTSA